MESSKSLRPGVDVAVFVVKYKQILIGKRKGERGDGMWSLPGGRLRFREDIFDCAVRTTFEESSVRIKRPRVGPVTNENNLPYEDHSVTLFVVADYDSGNPTVAEPDERSEWRWCAWDRLPQPLFYALKNFVDAGFSPFDY